MEPIVRNVYCIGRNYKLHALELGNDVPTEPMVFMKPSHAVTTLGEGTILLMPLDKGAVHHELEIVLRIGRKVLPGMEADHVVESFALGIDFTLRDVQDVLKKNGHPWLAAKGMLQSGPVSLFMPYPGTEALKRTSFSMKRNGQTVQHGTVSDMIFSIDELISYVADHYGLGEGDLLFTGTPAGVGPVEAGDELVLLWGEEVLASLRIEEADKQ